MADFYHVNSNRVIGGQARVLISPGTNPIPTLPTNVVDLSTYAAVATTYGWKDIGTTKSASRVSKEAAMNEWRGEQQGPIRKMVTDHRGTASFEIEEFLTDNPVVDTVPGAVSKTAPVAGWNRRNFNASDTIPYVHIAFVRKAPDGQVYITIVTKAQWDGSALQRAFTRGESESMQFNATIFPDTGNLDDVTGDPIMFYDLYSS